MGKWLVKQDYLLQELQLNQLQLFLELNKILHLVYHNISIKELLFLIWVPVHWILLICAKENRLILVMIVEHQKLRKLYMKTFVVIMKMLLLLKKNIQH